MNIYNSVINLLMLIHSVCDYLLFVETCKTKQHCSYRDYIHLFYIVLLFIVQGNIVKQ